MRKWLYFIAASIAGPVMLGCVLFTTPALADVTPQPVTAQVEIATVLTATGFSPSVDFGSAVPGQNVTVPSAEAFTITTNNATGATASIASSSGIFHNAGNTVSFPDTALMFHTQTNSTRAGHGTTAPVVLETVPTGTTAITESWELDVPTGLSGSGTLSDSLTISVVANA